MKATVKAAAGGAVALALAGLGTWWWAENMELGWQRQVRANRTAMDQPYLGATWLLQTNGFKVDAVRSTGLLDAATLGDGTLVLGGVQGVITQAKSDQLLTWVARGNTLVFQPREASAQELHARRLRLEAEEEQGEEEADEKADTETDKKADGEDEEKQESKAPGPESSEEAAAESAAAPAPAAKEEKAHDVATVPAAPAGEIEPDALSAAFNVRSSYVTRPQTCTTLSQRLKPNNGDDDELPRHCPAGSVATAALRMVDLPGMGEIRLDAGSVELLELSADVPPLWTDNVSDAVRAYRHGKGYVIFAPGHLFRNDALRDHDHGALLLGLARLNAAHKTVTLVNSRTMVPWYRLLWMHYHMLLISLAALLALLFWAAVRRFGPLLPDPAPARRSLMEHVDASGAWLWKARGGRPVLIDAARADLRAAMQRRAPALLRLPDTQQHEALARLTQLDEASVASAMHGEPGSLDAAFTQQIRTLQVLRKHHER